MVGATKTLLSEISHLFQVLRSQMAIGRRRRRGCASPARARSSTAAAAGGGRGRGGRGRRCHCPCSGPTSCPSRRPPGLQERCEMSGVSSAHKQREVSLKRKTNSEKECTFVYFGARKSFNEPAPPAIYQPLIVTAVSRALMLFMHPRREATPPEEVHI